MKYLKSMLFAVMVLGLVVPDRAEAAQKVYWLNDQDGQLMRANLNGWNAEGCALGFNLYWDPVLAPHIDSLYEPGKVLVGWNDGWIDWATCDGSYVNVKGGGSGIRALVLRPGNPSYVYYATFDNQIWRIRLDGSSNTYLFTVGSRVWDMAFAGNRLYWSITGSTGGIYRADPAGGNRARVKYVPDRDFLYIDVDSTHIYFTYGNSYRVLLDGSSEQLVHSPVWGSPRLDGLGKLYWAHASDWGILRCNVDGSGTERIVESSWAGDIRMYKISLEVGPTSCSATVPFGDVADAHPNIDFNDIARVVSCYTFDVWGDEWDKCDLYPCGQIFGNTQCIGNGVVDFKDIAMAVAIFVANPDPPNCN